ncbi:MAG: hypothetical protein NZL96_00585 [Patescibacteria group bacterium]|nr:hypothetical protein [Patescibacteria group bacterium]
MEKERIKELFFGRKGKRYIYFTLFFFTFSIFILFAIYPSLKTILLLIKERDELREIEASYNSQIANIYQMMSEIEENRDKLYLVDQAISLFPQVNKITDDVKSLADKNNLFIRKASISDINLIIKKNDSGTVSLILEGTVTFDDLNRFIDDLFNQRRLKTIEALTITQDKETTESGKLDVLMKINSFYL